jgi:hypothetical protein
LILGWILHKVAQFKFSLVFVVDSFGVQRTAALVLRKKCGLDVRVIIKYCNG